MYKLTFNWRLTIKLVNRSEIPLKTTTRSPKNVGNFFVTSAKSSSNTLNWVPMRRLTVENGNERFHGFLLTLHIHCRSVRNDFIHLYCFHFLWSWSFFLSTSVLVCSSEIVARFHWQWLWAYNNDNRVCVCVSNFRDCATRSLIRHYFVHTKWPTLAWFVCINKSSSRGITFTCAPFFC